MNKIVVGDKATFLAEIHKKHLILYKPDKYSKKEDAYEKYSLGEIVLDTDFMSISVKKPVTYNLGGYKMVRTSELIITVKDKSICITDKITTKGTKGTKRTKGTKGTKSTKGTKRTIS